MSNFEIVRGDTWRRTATVLDQNGDAYDFTGATVWWTLRDPNDTSSDDDDALVKLYWVSGGSSSGITISSPTSGVMIVTVTAAQTAALALKSYVFDTQVENAAGDIESPSSGAGTFIVLRDTTIRTTTP